jgi:hypothetical protein
MGPNSSFDAQTMRAGIPADGLAETGRYAAFSSMVTLFFMPPRSFEKRLNVLPSRP